jgi:hypothetical protein
MAVARKRPKVRPPRQKPPPPSAYKTLLYELNCLNDAYSEYTRLTLADEIQSPLNNAALESFLIHVRNLRDFFVGTRQSNDILAIDFVNPRPRFRLSTLRALQRRLDRQLAHPSYSRPHLNRLWPIEMLKNELMEAWALFLKRLGKANPRARAIFRRLSP